MHGREWAGFFPAAASADPPATGAAKVAFTSPPKVERAGEGFRITFTVSSPADVELAIVDGKGRVVRHLAAGLLGHTAPPPLRADSLAQELSWDGKDDAGRPAGPDLTGFKLRVRAGLSAALDRVVGWDANTMTGAIVGVAVNAKGEVFALDSDGRMKVFDRAGKYLRTIMPYPADTPAERLASVGQLEIAGQRLPVVYSAHPDNNSTDSVGSFYPLTVGLVRQQIAVGPDGTLYLASAVGTYVHHGLPRYLLALSPQGGAPPDKNFVGPKIREPNNFLGGAGERGVTWMDHLAASPDGRWVYLNQAGESGRFKRSHAVFRVAWSDARLGEPFVGQAEPGSDDAHLNNPQGVAVDKAGNLHVCDWGNNRVVVYSADGKRLGQFPADAPEQIAVSVTSGTIYVVSRGREAKRNRPVAETTLRKFSPWASGGPKEQAALPLKTIEAIAVDAAAETPIVWASVSRGWARPYDLAPIFDRGAKLEAGPSIVNHDGLEHPANIAADPARNRLIVRERDCPFLTRRIFELDLASGKKKPLFAPSAPGPVFALDSAGNIYVAADYAREGIDRFDPQGKPLPFAALESNHIGWELKNPHWPRGLAVGADGRIYVLRNVVRHVAGQVDVFAPDGKPIKSGLVGGVDRGASGIGVDAAGNVYLGVNVKAKDQPIPADFAGKASATPFWFWLDPKRYPQYLGDRTAPWAYTFYNPYLYHWGSIVKFAPAGGAFYGLRPKPFAKDAPDDPYNSLANAPPGGTDLATALLERDVKCVGAQWVRHGYGPVASQDCRWGDPGCCCATAGFAVDPFGRVFYPNVFRFCVEAVDSAGNPVGRIGQYGNADAPSSPGSPVAFAWPCFVAWTDGRLYVSDAINQRVVIVRLDAQVEAEAGF